MRKKQLVIEGDQGWQYIFRKQKNRPIEMLKKHKKLGALGGWQVAKNFCLRGKLNAENICKHFGISEWQFRYGKTD